MLTYCGAFHGFTITAPGLTVSLFLWGLLLSLAIIYRSENHSNILTYLFCKCVVVPFLKMNDHIVRNHTHVYRTLHIQRDSTITLKQLKALVAVAERRMHTQKVKVT